MPTASISAWIYLGRWLSGVAICLLFSVSIGTSVFYASARPSLSSLQGDHITADTTTTNSRAMSEANSSNNGQSSSVKTVYLVRHAESEENRRLSSLRNIGYSMMSFSMPSGKDVSSSMELLHITGQIDTPLSQDGRAQVTNVARQLEQSNFFEKHGIQLVAHSPLERARDTAAGLLDCGNGNTNSTKTVTGTVTAEILQAERDQRVVELEYLLERQPSEWIPGNTGSMWRRIKNLEVWLASQPETNIVCVGHSQFFKSMLNLDFKFGNCDVWQIQLDATNNGTKDSSSTNSEYPNLPPQWSGLKRLFQVEEN